MTAWQVRKTSVLGTILPVAGAVVGGAVLIYGFLAVIFGTSNRLSESAAAFSIGLLALAFSTWRIVVPAREVISEGHGIFRFRSLRRELVVEAGEVESLTGRTGLMDMTRTGPVRLRTAKGSMWITRQMPDIHQLERALQAANPEMYSDETLEPWDWWLGDWWRKRKS
jgi:hypothetical protein